MRKGILAIAAAGSVFALTAAGASGLTYSPAANSVFVTGSGTQTVSTWICTGTPEINYDRTATGVKDEITKVTVTGLVCPDPAETGHTYVYQVVLKDGTPADNITGALTVSTAVAADDPIEIVAFKDAALAAALFDVAAHPLTATDLTVTPTP